VAVRICRPRLYVAVAVVINTTVHGGIQACDLTLQSGMLPVDHCDLYSVMVLEAEK